MAPRIAGRCADGFRPRPCACTATRSPSSWWTGAGRARLLPRFHAPVRREASRRATTACSTPPTCPGCWAAWSCSPVRALPAALEPARPARLRAGRARRRRRRAGHGWLHRPAAPGRGDGARRGRAGRGVAAAGRHRPLLPAAARLRRRRALRRARRATSGRCAASGPGATRATSSSSAPATAAGWSCARSCATPSSATARWASSTTTRPSAGCASRAGVKVLGATDDLPRILDEAETDEVIIAIPSAPGTLRARVVSACRDRGIPVRTLPTVFELLQTGGGDVVRQVREVRVEDVLGREPVRMELERVGAYLAGRGRAGHRRRRLDRLRAVPPDRARGAAPADPARPRRGQPVRDPRASSRRTATSASPRRSSPTARRSERMREVFAEHRPTSSSTPPPTSTSALMECNPVEAVRNNALATRLWPTSPARPGSSASCSSPPTRPSRPRPSWAPPRRWPSGRSRRPARRFPDTRFAAVRFGNVLGSSGSVVPIFRRQIARGGPVTVTDPRMTRYFMTIPEAVQLDHPRRLAGRAAARSSCSRWASPCGSCDLAREMIRAVRPASPSATSRSRSSAAGRARSCTRSCSTPTSGRSRRPPRRSCWPSATAARPRLGRGTFDEINLLVLEGDAAAPRGARSPSSRGRAGARLAAVAADGPLP